MSMTKPMALSKSAFDASNAELFYFTSSGGDQVVKNRLTIRNNSTNVVVYQATVESYLFQQSVPSGTLTNGVYYNYYFNTYDVNENISPDSNVVAFYCYSTPTITYTNYPNDNIINSSSYTFNVTYAQTQGELLNSLIYYLYDSNGVELSNSGALYSSLTPPLSFAHTFSGFDTDSTYKIQVKAVSVNGTIVTSELKTFNTSYYFPELYSLLKLDNLCADGIVRATSNVVLVRGTTNVEPTLFYSDILDGNEDNYIKWNEGYTIGDDKIISAWTERYMVDLRASGTVLTLESGFSIPSDFQFQSWQYPIRDGVLYEFKNSTIPSNHITLTLKSGIPSGESTVKNWFELSSTNGALFDYSNYVDAMNTDTKFIVWFKKIGNVYNLLLDVTSVGTGGSISWAGSSIYPSAKVNNDISTIFPLDTVSLQNGAYDNLDITSNTSRAYSQTYPTWDYYTRINCGFDSLSGGNISLVLSQLEGIKLKRREKNTFDWITLDYIPVNGEESLSFIYNDTSAPTNIEFDYAIVPILSGNVEGAYIIESVESLFNGCFITDGSSTFKLYNNVIYPSISNSLTAGVLTPIGRQYPILVYNTYNDFDSGTMSADLCGYNFDTTRKIDRKDVQVQVTAFKAFLKNKKPKILKDWDGRIKLINIAGSLQENVDLISGKVNISFAWVEQGAWNSQSDLTNTGFLTIQ